MWTRGMQAATVTEMALELTAQAADDMVQASFDAYPHEACGLLAAAPGSDEVVKTYPCRNAAESAKVYEVDSKDYLKANRDAEDNGLEIMAVFHSHTHTDAYPSPTDVENAPDPNWHYVLVSLAGEEPAIRSFRIKAGNIEEEPVVLV